MTPRTPPLTALLVDDEPVIRRVAALGLQRAGWTVFEAASGSEALQVARARQPDVILLDVVMPNLDGPATLALLRKDVVTRGIPVVLLTGKAAKHDLQELVALDAVGIIAKPFDPMTLAGEVQRLIDRP